MSAMGTILTLEKAKAAVRGRAEFSGGFSAHCSRPTGSRSLAAMADQGTSGQYCQTKMEEAGGLFHFQMGATRPKVVGRLC